MASPRRWAVFAALLLACAQAPGQTADALRGRFEAARSAAAANIFDRPLYLQSTETADRLQGDVYARLDYPFTEVLAALKPADRWCSVLILHLNIKYCRAGGDPVALDVGLGRKIDEPLSSAYWLHFDYRVSAASADFLALQLQAPSGPMGTSDYRIVVEAAPLSDGRTVLHMGYGYGYGMAARFAMQAYLSTLGSAKIGFSASGRNADGTPQRVGGVRGVVERNTMRYYFAIETYLGVLGLPPAQQMGRAFEDWFDATERYPQQLHEVDRADYIAMKTHELQREQTEAPPGR